MPAALLLHMTQHGGSIVSVTDCTAEEIATAMDEERFANDPAGNGYILRPSARRQGDDLTTSALHMPR